MNPTELADHLAALCVQGRNVSLMPKELALVVTALHLADAAADPNFPRLELGKLRSAYLAVRDGT